MFLKLSKLSSMGVLKEEGGGQQATVDFEFLGPIPGKFMVGAVEDFTLQPMARTNHKFPGSGGRML